jgi:hypothetical protein
MMGYYTAQENIQGFLEIHTAWDPPLGKASELSARRNFLV